jgi:hypothetical protein
MCHGQLLDNAIRKARKAHRCTGCSREIKAGERYQRQAIAEDGSVRTWIGCEECSIETEAVYQLLNHDDACETRDPRDALREEARGGGWRAVRAAMRKAKNKLFGTRGGKT